MPKSTRYIGNIKRQLKYQFAISQFVRAEHVLHYF